jgi:Mechanosensitive ion channel, conserved TM helix
MLAGIEFSQGLTNAWNDIVTFVPKFLGFLVILVIGYFVAKVIAKILDRILERVGFDRVVERGGVKTALAKSKYDASDILSKIVFYALMLFVIQLAFGVFGPNPISDLIKGVIAYLPRIFVAIVIVIVAAAIGAALREILGSMLGGLSYGRILATGAYVAILAIGIFAALDELQIAPAIVHGLFYAILAIIAGAAIVAIGGGGVMPMRRVWERSLARIETEAPRIRAQAKAAGGPAPTKPIGDAPSPTIEGPEGSIR